jgi:Holliday junction resolvase|tara:strand:+ start:29384 stop:29782 length:399 start_codon:yes stop_codon:yes gene_type:complete
VGSKAKGTRAERELLHMFHEKDFAVLRVAGSGSSTIPSCDLLVGKDGRSLAVECKFIKDKIYFRDEQIKELKEFSKIFGANLVFAIKVMSRGWFFLDLESLGKSSKGTYLISYDVAKEKGLSFDEFILNFEK